MIHFKTLGALACITLLATTGVLGSYKYLPEINGWIRIHEVAVKWQEALEHCENQSAVLMSPNNMELYIAMVALNEDNSTYFIGAKAEFDRKLFVSIEGVPLYDMPVTHMTSRLNYQDGECLSMNSDIIRVVPCTERLPYICYKEKTNDLVLTECGTFDQGYKLSNTTGSCYKHHEEDRSWTEAYAACMAEGAYLVIINNENEAKELQKIIVSKQSSYALIGLRCTERKGNWRSIHGHRVQEIYNKWSSNADSESCLFSGMYPESAQLYALDISYKRHFVCEKDPNYVMFPVKHNSRSSA